MTQLSPFLRHKRRYAWSRPFHRQPWHRRFLWRLFAPSQITCCNYHSLRRAGVEVWGDVASIPGAELSLVQAIEREVRRYPDIDHKWWIRRHAYMRLSLQYGPDPRLHAVITREFRRAVQGN